MCIHPPKAGRQIAEFKNFVNFDKFFALINTLKGIAYLLADVDTTKGDANLMYAKVEGVIDSGNPNLFNTTDRQKLAQGVFLQDLSIANRAILNLTNIRDTTDSLVAPALSVSFSLNGHACSNHLHTKHNTLSVCLYVYINTAKCQGCFRVFGRCQELCQRGPH